MRLAMAISPSRESNSTEPISRRYMRTGSSVRPMSSSAMLPAVGLFSGASGAFSSGSSPSITVMPISESMDMVSSICSEDIWSGGSTWFSSS